MDKEQLHILLQRYMDQSATAMEEQELMQLLTDPTNESLIRELLAEHWEQWPGKLLLSKDQSEELYSNINRVIIPENNGNAKRVVLYRWWKWAAAAIVIVLGAGAWFYFNHNPPQELAKITIPAVQDVAAPQNARAVITLANGKKIYLDSSDNGIVATENNINVIKTGDGQINYQSSTGNQPSTNLLYNTLINPRGSKVVSLVLGDGTKVWLNAESSLKYPVAFTGDERKVEITGEAYFEVAKDAAKPFKVIKGDAEVMVLGTHFNVNAYDDEEAIRITLLEGSVKVSSAVTHQSSFIRPGQQLQVTSSQQLMIYNDVNVEQVMAWKNGYFEFNGNDVQTVMRQVARWYDVDIAYEGKIPERQFAGQMQRTALLSNVLKVLEESNVHFHIEGKKVTVTP